MHVKTYQRLQTWESRHLDHRESIFRALSSVWWRWRGGNKRGDEGERNIPIKVMKLNQ